MRSLTQLPRRHLRPARRLAVGLLLAAHTVLLAATLASAAEVYFSPNGGARQALVRAIQDSRTSIDVAVYNFTAAELLEALFKARTRGVRVRVILDRERMETGGATIKALRRSSLSLRALGVREESLMHNKFAVFDGKLVATGSYNWTNAAEHANYENLVLLDDPEVVERFEREFSRLWRKAEP